MNTKIMALVVRHKDTNRILDVIPVGNQYDDVLVEYLSEYCTKEELLNAYRGWSKSTRNDIAENFDRAGIHTIQCEAKDVPSVGKMKVAIETKEIDWR
jgi:hypothetical protein